MEVFDGGSESVSNKDFSDANKSNKVRNLLIVSSILLLGGLVGIGVYIAFDSGVSSINQLFSKLFTLGGAFPNLAIAANALAILSAICITIALGMAINKQINSKTLKALANFVLTLALGMVTVSLLALIFGITVPTLFAGFADLVAVFSQGASAQAVLTGIILAISLISLVVAFVTYKSGGDGLSQEDEADLEAFGSTSSFTDTQGLNTLPDTLPAPRSPLVSNNEQPKKQINFYDDNNDKKYEAKYKITEDSDGIFKYTLVDKTLQDVPPEFYSKNSDLKHVKLPIFDGIFVEEYSPPKAGARRPVMQQGVSPGSGSNSDSDSRPSSPKK